MDGQFETEMLIDLKLLHIKFLQVTYVEREDCKTVQVPKVTSVPEVKCQEVPEQKCETLQEQECTTKYEEQCVDKVQDVQ